MTRIRKLVAALPAGQKTFVDVLPQTLTFVELELVLSFSGSVPSDCSARHHTETPLVPLVEIPTTTEFVAHEAR